MIRAVGHLRHLLMMSAAIGCGVVGLAWPQWAAELGAQGYYGYGYGRLDHFKCYEAKPEQKVERHEVLVQDQFGSKTVVVGRPRLLCNPAVKDEDPRHPVKRFPDDLNNPVDHLVCYEVLRAKGKEDRDRDDRDRDDRDHGRDRERREVSVENQFGLHQHLAVTESELLCLPSLKTLR